MFQKEHRSELLIHFRRQVLNYVLKNVLFL